MAPEKQPEQAVAMNWSETFQFMAQSPFGAWENIFDKPRWQLSHVFALFPRGTQGHLPYCRYEGGINYHAWGQGQT